MPAPLPPRSRAPPPAASPVANPFRLEEFRMYGQKLLPMTLGAAALLCPAAGTAVAGLTGLASLPWRWAAALALGCLLLTLLSALLSLIYLFQIGSFAGALVGPALLLVLAQVLLNMLAAWAGLRHERTSMAVAPNWAALCSHCFPAFRKSS